MRHIDKLAGIRRIHDLIEVVLCFGRIHSPGIPQPQIQRELTCRFPVILKIGSDPRFAKEPCVVELTDGISCKDADISLQELEKTIEIVSSGSAKAGRVVLMKTIKCAAKLQTVRAACPKQVVCRSEAVWRDDRRQDSAWTKSGQTCDGYSAILNAKSWIELQRMRSVG